MREAKNLKLTNIISIYDNGNDCYMELHDVIHATKLCNARPFTLDFIKKLKINTDSININIKGIMDNILYVNISTLNTYIVYREESLRHEMIFNDKTYHIGFPNPVFIYNNGRIKVYSSKTLNDNSKLYVAPIPNTQGDGSICMGNVKIPEMITINQFIKDLSSVFWSSTNNMFPDICRKPMKELYEEFDGGIIPQTYLMEANLKIKDLFI